MQWPGERYLSYCIVSSIKFDEGGIMLIHHLDYPVLQPLINFVAKLQLLLSFLILGDGRARIVDNQHYGKISSPQTSSVLLTLFFMPLFILIVDQL